MQHPSRHYLSAPWQWQRSGLEKTRVWLWRAPTDEKPVGPGQLGEGRFLVGNRRALRAGGAVLVDDGRPRGGKLGQPVYRFVLGRDLKLELPQLGLGLLQLLVELGPWLGHGAGTEVLVRDDLRCGRSQVQILTDHRLKRDEKIVEKWSKIQLPLFKKQNRLGTGSRSILIMIDYH